MAEHLSLPSFTGMIQQTQEEVISPESSTSAQEANEEVAFLRARLEQKDKEVFSLLQRIAMLEGAAARGADDSKEGGGPTCPLTTLRASPLPPSLVPHPHQPPSTCFSFSTLRDAMPLSCRESVGLDIDNDEIIVEEEREDTPLRPLPPFSSAQEEAEIVSQQQQQRQSQEDQQQSTPESMVDFPSINSSSILLLSAAHHARNGSSVRLPEPLHQTDTASIRRRYMALEKGPGTKQDLLFANPDKLFQSTVVLDFDEDSPSFRRKLQAMDENVEGMRNHLQRLVTIIQKYIEAGLAFSSVGRNFASELMHLQGESWFTRLGDLAPALVRFGETFDEIQNYQDAVLMSLEATFLAPMREFVKRELKEVKDMKEELHRAHEDYLMQLQKYLQLKRGAESEVIQTKTQELIVVRRRYELSRLDLVNTLNQLETKKKFQLVERVLCALYAYLGFFHQGHGELANLEPSMRDLQHQLRLSRREFAKQSRIAEAKRMQLEVHLSSALKGIKGQLALDDWGNMFAPEEASVVHQSAFGVDHDHSHQWNRGTASPTASNGSCSSLRGPMSLQHGNNSAGRGNGGGPHMVHFVSKSSSSGSIRSISIRMLPTPISVAADSQRNILRLEEGEGEEGQQKHSQQSLESGLDEIEVIATPIIESSSLSKSASSHHKQQQDHPPQSPHHYTHGEDRTHHKQQQDHPPQSPHHYTHGEDRRTSDVTSSVRFQAVVKQGYLWKRSSNVRKDWKRRFFFIRGGKLSYQRENDPIGPPRADICDLLISTVRECLKEHDTRHTFEIISPGKRPYMLQAENEEEYQEWIKALRSQTETLLVAGLDPTVQLQSMSAGAHNKTNLNMEFLERLREANPVCADCHGKGPEWASINFGIMICIECSGIHRSLGVHISKVRSLTLDKWTRSLRAVMEEMGNQRFNAIWEVEVPSNRNKPGATAAREEREAWIREKYLERAFISLAEGDEEDANLLLYAAALEGQLEKVMWSLAHGADGNWVNGKQRGRTAMHAVCEGGSLVCLELLYQNGGNLDVIDQDEVAPLELAMNRATGSRTSMISYILSKLEKDGG